MTNLNKQLGKVFLGVTLVIAGMAHAGESLWEVDQVAQQNQAGQTQQQIVAKIKQTVKLKLPKQDVAKAILEEMDSLIEELIVEQKVDRVAEEPVLARLQTSVKRELGVVEKYGDFYKASLDSGVRLLGEMRAESKISEQHAYSQITTDLVNTPDTKIHGLKLIRLEYELKERCE